MTESNSYGLWSLVAFNSLVILIFAFSFVRPQGKRDWRSFGAFSAFVVALFAEMYGFPLSIYLLWSWLGSRFPSLNLLSHNSGHLWHTILGLKGDAHLDPLHIASYILIFSGFVILARSWRVLYQAQQQGKVASEGPYAHIRHPQYVGFMVIMSGFLLQWPTLPTLVMFPFLVWMYARLARREEKEARARFGDDYTRYAAETPAFFPSLRFRSV